MTRSPILVLGLVCIVTAAASLLTGCTSTKESTYVLPAIPSTFPDHPAPEILARVHASTDTLRAVRTKTRIRYETPEDDGSANLNIDYRRGDTLRASIRVTLGIEGGKALVTRDSFFVYNRVSKKLYYGEAEAVRAFFPTPAPISELFPSMTGALEPDPAIGWQVTADSSYYYLVNETAGLRYTVDPRIWRVVEMQQSSWSGEIEEIRRFTDFDEFGAALIPRRIEAERPRDGQKIRVYHRSVEVNPPSLFLKLDEGDVKERILVRPRES